MSSALRRICIMAALSACGGHTLDVGSVDGGPGTTAIVRLGGDAGLAGPLWNGTIEKAQLSNGSDRLEMTLSIASDGTATGSLLLGAGALLKPPTNPDVGYPPGVIFPIVGGPLGFFEGFPYTMIDGRLDGSTLTFHVNEFELWMQWCALQKPVFITRDVDGGSVYSCSPYGSFSISSSSCAYTDPSTGQSTPIDCGKESLCGFDSPCDCSATACRVANWAGPDLSFDLTINATTADGTMSGLLGDHAVHFVRAQ
jgi:hypothetical protein